MRDKVFRIIRASIPEPGRRNLVEAYINALERELDRAREKAITDELTGIDNRRAFEIALKRMISRSLRIQISPSLHNKPKSILSCITSGWEYPISCVMADIDHFKDVNDTYGHQTGDVALKFFAGFLGDELSDTDTIGRFGGEEFTIALEGTSHKGAFRSLNEMREKIKTQPFSGNLTLRFSAGISSSEHNPEIVLLYSKKILSALREFLKGKAVPKAMADIARRLQRKVGEVEQWFHNIRSIGEEYIEKGYKGTLQDLLTYNRSDFACFMFIQRSDQALYRAKQTGRDKVCVWTPEGIVDTVSST